MSGPVINRRSFLGAALLSGGTAVQGGAERPIASRLTPVAAFAASPALDTLIQQAVAEDQIPGAVLLVAHEGKIVHHKAYGWRALVPQKELMTLDTIFDVASLTKVIATTPALMSLFEAGNLRLNDKVTQYLPEFQGGASNITVRNLMTHFSGLRPDLTLNPAWSGYDTGVNLAVIDKPVVPPGVQFLYSDINFILLGEIVRRLSGKALPDFAREKVYAPLGMAETMFLPPASLRHRIAPTEKVEGRFLRGIVHDETTRYMGGIAGHAGVFSTAADLARYCEMMLGLGAANGARLFSALTVRKFTTPQTPPDQPILRGLGWDIDSPLAGNRGELFPIGSYGHTGFTGTSIWIDPASGTYVILLSNAVHPVRRPAITSLRGRVATTVAAAVGLDAPGITLTGYNETLSGAGVRRVVARNAQVLTGLDVLVQQKFAPLNGKRVGLITNQTGLDREGRRNIDRMVEAGVRLTSIFSPEHGLTGQLDQATIGNSRDQATGIPVLSLYSGKNRRPSGEMLRDLDVLVFDIQDIGARFYTYVTTMAYAMEEAAKQHISYFVLDRPNPITGTHVEGPLLEPDLVSFIGYYPLPLRHGMTAGEMARMFNSRNRIGAALKVIAMRNWQRGDWFDSTGLAWTDPSPNMRSLEAALLYPGLAMLEGSKNYSVGRGTDAPFEQVGADWIRGPELSAWLNARFIPGVRVYPTRFTPASSNFAGRMIEGVRFVVTEREAFDSSRLGLELAYAFQGLYPGKIDYAFNRGLIGSRQVIGLLESGEDPLAILQAEEEARQDFLRVREEYLLYK
jgi:uncharacterized protein YbbC (DUF1343 family)/CubicO group peptidase (beta-lactamase class C family)